MSNLDSTLLSWKESLQQQLARLVEQKWVNVGLRAKMGLMVTAGLVGLLVVFALLGISTVRQASQQVLSERVMLARMSATTIDSTLHHIETMLSVLASQQALHDGEIDPARRKAALAQIDIYHQGIFLFDESGRLLDSTQESVLPVDWNRVEAVQSALDGKQFGLSVLPGDKPQAIITVPVMDGQSHASGVLAVALDLTNPAVFPVEQRFDLGATGALDVVDASGRVLISTSPERVMTGGEQDEILGKLFIAGQPGVETCLGCYGDASLEPSDRVIAFAPLSHAPWGVVIHQKADEMFAPVRGLLLRTLILGLATVTGALVLVWITTNSVIKPVQTLTEAAMRIAAGDLSTPIKRPLGRSRSDEIGALAESFITMRMQLKHSMDEIQALNRDLDARVRERTLAARAAQLEAQTARDDIRAIIDALSDELVVVGVDDYRVQQVNKAAQNRYPFQDPIIGKACFEVFHCGQPCQAPNCECPIPAVMANGESVKVTHIHGDPDLDQQIYVDIVASPMRSTEGQITRIVELSRDVTSEKRIKDSLVRRNQQLAILNAVAMVVSQSLHLEDILGKALEEVLRFTGIDVGVVFLQDETLGNLKLMAYRGLSEEAARLAAQIGMLDSSCGGIMEKGQVIIVPDLSRYRGKRARSLQRENLSTLVHVPLTAKGCTLGSMCVGTRQKREFGSEEQELLTAIGNQIAVAIENARLYAEVQHKEQVRGELFRKAINAQEEERKRIARELHDDTSQALTALLFASEEAVEMDNLAEVKHRLERMRQLAQHTLDGVHKLMFDLRPSLLDHLGLVPALRWYANSRLGPMGIHVSIVDGSGPRRLQAEVETALFRVVQESISNIARHAAARNVCISFQFDHDFTTVSVEDDGIGFEMEDLNLSPETPRGLGLLGMQERIELLGGDLEITTSLGLGTQILIRVPAGVPEEPRETTYA